MFSMGLYMMLHPGHGLSQESCKDPDLREADSHAPAPLIVLQIATDLGRGQGTPSVWYHGRTFSFKDGR